MHIIRQYLKVLLQAAKLKPCLALNTKQPVSCLKKTLLKCPGLKFWEAKINKSQLECLKCGVVKLIQIGFRSERLAALCKKYGSKFCCRTEKQCRADSGERLRSAAPEQHFRRFPIFQSLEFFSALQGREQAQPRCSHVLFMLIKWCTVLIVRL